MSEKKNGRPRVWNPERTVRVLTKFDRSMVNTLDILVEYLREQAKERGGNPFEIDRSSLVHSAVNEYIQSHATIIQTALQWYRKKNKPRRGG